MIKLIKDPAQEERRRKGRKRDRTLSKKKERRTKTVKGIKEIEKAKRKYENIKKYFSKRRNFPI